jgi:hypothetical protein
MALRTHSIDLSATLLGGSVGVLLIASAGLLVACNDDDPVVETEAIDAGGAGGAAGATGALPGGSPGAAGSDGAAGAAGLDCSSVPTGDADDLLIDDFATDDFLVPQHGSRIGEWYQFADGTADVDISHDAGVDGEDFAIHIEGGPFESWGAGFGLTLNQPDADGVMGGGLSCAYDASAYSGIRFSVRGAGTFRVTVQSMNVVPPSGGGTCDSSCYDAHTARFEATDDWQEITVPFRILELRPHRPARHPVRGELAGCDRSHHRRYLVRRR